MKLSVLICTLPERQAKFERLWNQLINQYRSGVHFLVDNHDQITIGEKRNRLLARANSEYVCFIDDDDIISAKYITNILNALQSKPDCVGIEGIMLCNGNCPRKFYHTVEAEGWYTSGATYWRTPNHLNPIRTDIVKQIGFNASKSFGEDLEFSKRVRPLLKSEVMIEEPIYYYLYNLKQHESLFCF
jgi:glycosyltransferase involved in cell wall biosynthesis